MKKLSTLVIGCMIIFSFGCKDEEPEAVETHTVILKIDSYEDGGNRNFIGNLKATEEAAVTFSQLSKTFTISSISLMFGGTGNTPVAREVNLKVYKDNGAVNPGTLLLTKKVGLISSLTKIHEIDVSGDNVKVSGGGSIRVAVQMIEAGFPSVAQETDGPYDNSINWIKDKDGKWNSSDGIGLTGNWVIRAKVEEEI